MLSFQTLTQLDKNVGNVQSKTLLRRLDFQCVNTEQAFAQEHLLVL